MHKTVVSQPGVEEMHLEHAYHHQVQRPCQLIDRKDFVLKLDGNVQVYGINRQVTSIEGNNQRDQLSRKHQRSRTSCLCLFRFVFFFFLFLLQLGHLHNRFRRSTRENDDNDNDDENDADGSTKSKKEKPRKQTARNDNVDTVPSKNERGAPN